MNEGEFKKWIVTIVAESLAEQAVNGKNSILQNLNNMINEAKKEFYQWMQKMMPESQVGKLVIVTERDLTQDELQFLCQWIWDARTLILKWFGTEQK